MLTIDQRYILSLLHESFICKRNEECSYEDWHAVANIINRNGILLTVYQKLATELQKQLAGTYYAAVKQAVTQEHEGKLILKALSNAGFDCIALKGWELRKLYPEPTMRQMADLDILVRPYEYGRIKAVMNQLGYISETESSWKHDNFKKNDVTVEMHKRLTDDSGVIRAWEKGIWDRASRVEGNVFRMSAEDFYIYHFVHLYKDFVNGSLGLRRIVDTWLLQKQPVEMSVVKSLLESFGMWKFHERMVKLSRATMGDEPLDEGSELLLKHAFTHGIYGSDKSYKAGRIAAMGGNLKRGKLYSKLAAVFLPYARMKAQFPVLERFSILLPFCWSKRIIRLLKGNMKKNRKMLDYSDITESDYEEMKSFFAAGGIEQ